MRADGSILYPNQYPHLEGSELRKQFLEATANETAEESDNHDIVDDKTMHELRNKILSLQTEREEADRNQDLAKKNQISAELEQLENYWHEISRTCVKSKKVVKKKRFSSNEYRKRDNVKQHILRAILKLKKYDRKAWQHFDVALKPVGLDYVPVHQRVYFG